MQILRWLVEEARSIAWITLYFAACLVVIMLLKQLWLAEYAIAFSGIATALVAALVTAKVVIVLDHAPLTRWLRNSPGIIEVITRSAVYTLGVLVALVLERAFEARTEQGGMIGGLGERLRASRSAQVGGDHDRRWTFIPGVQRLRSYQPGDWRQANGRVVPVETRGGL